MFNKSNFCHIASNNRNEQKGSVFIYKTSDTLAQVTQSGYFNEKLIDINLHDLIIHVQYDPVARTLKKSVLIVTERTMDNVETAPILDQTIGDDIADLGDQVQGIEEKIPENASAQNQLATKNQITDLQNSKQDKGDYATNTALSQGLAQKQDIATAVNYDNITNCITEIPQDIKLELNNGTLTLKAGSKVYVPNGAGVFDEVTIANDISNSGNAEKSFVITNGSILVWTSNISSGGTAPANPSNGQIWYDTTNNVVKRYSTGSSTWVGGFSLPVALLNPNATTSTTITEKQVFNGFGYIGSTVFALPGVKGLISDGRNADGTLKNINMTVQSVLTKAILSNTGWHYITINTTGTNFDFATNYYTGTELPSGATNYSRFYNTAENLTYNVASGELTQSPQFILGCYIDHSTSSPYKINSMKQTTAFHAVDYNDFESTVEEINSSISAAVEEINSSTTAELANKANTSANNFTAAGKGTIVNLTMPNYSAGVAFTLNPSTPYTAPKDGFVFILTGRANDQGSSIKINGTQVASTISNWSNIPYFFPVAKGTVVSTDYDTISSAIFYPLKGAI